MDAKHPQSLAVMYTDRLRTEIIRLRAENEKLRDVENQLLAKIELLRLWITNVATDDQLDVIVPVLHGATGRNLLAAIAAKGK